MPASARDLLLLMQGLQLQLRRLIYMYVGPLLCTMRICVMTATSPSLMRLPQWTFLPVYADAAAGLSTRFS